MLHFQHRWFALVVTAVALALFLQGRREAVAGGAPGRVSRAVVSLLHLVVLQVVLGLLVVVWNLPPPLASLHQAVAVGIFGVALFVCHQLQTSRGIAKAK